jgi:hypothetical protein
MVMKRWRSPCVLHKLSDLLEQDPWHSDDDLSVHDYKYDCGGCYLNRSYLRPFLHQEVNDARLTPAPKSLRGPGRFE